MRIISQDRRININYDNWRLEVQDKDDAFGIMGICDTGSPAVVLLGVYNTGKRCGEVMGAICHYSFVNDMFMQVLSKNRTNSINVYNENKNQPKSNDSFFMPEE